MAIESFQDESSWDLGSHFASILDARDHKNEVEMHPQLQKAKTKGPYETCTGMSGLHIWPSENDQRCTLVRTRPLGRPPERHLCRFRGFRAPLEVPLGTILVVVWYFLECLMFDAKKVKRHMQD